MLRSHKRDSTGLSGGLTDSDQPRKRLRKAEPKSNAFGNSFHHFREPYPTPPESDTSSQRSYQYLQNFSHNSALDRPQSLRIPSSSIIPRTETKSYFTTAKQAMLLKREQAKLDALVAKEREEQSRRARLQAQNRQEQQENIPSTSYAEFRTIVTKAYKAFNVAFETRKRPQQSSILDQLGRNGKSSKQYRQSLVNGQLSLRAPLPAAPTEGFDQLSLKAARNDRAVVRMQTRRRLFRKALEAEKQARVKELLSTKGIVSTMPGAEVGQKDLVKLKPGVWLNDEVINFYMIMLNQRSKAAVAQQAKGVEEPAQSTPGKRKRKKNTQGQEILKIHAFTSFFYVKLQASGYEGVRRWTKKVDIFACDAVLMPINISDAHWVSACINIRLKRFEFYDSMGNWKQSIVQDLRDWLVAEHLDKKKKPLDISEWTDWSPEDVPEQDNGYDCGVFVSQIMEVCSRKDAAFDFSQAEMPYLRSKMIWEIGEQRFLDEEWD